LFDNFIKKFYINVLVANNFTVANNFMNSIKMVSRRNKKRYFFESDSRNQSKMNNW